MKEYIGKKIDMFIDDNKLVGELLDVRPFEIIIKTEDKIIHIPLYKIGMFSIVEEDVNTIVNANKPVVNIYMCKNDEAGCKGVKLLSLDDNVKISCVACDYDKKAGCDFGRIGNLYELPEKIQMAFLNGMATQTAMSVKKKTKIGEKNVKGISGTDRKNK